MIRAQARFPELKVVIHELEPADAIEAVRDGRCHLAVSFAYNFAPRPEIAGLLAHSLMDEPVLLALPPRWRRAADPVKLERLAKEDWIAGSREAEDRWLAERACAPAGFTPRITHTVDDYDLLLRMVSAGLGIGFVPELALRFSGAKPVVIRGPAGAPLRRRIYMLTRRALASSPLLRALLSELPQSG